MSKWSKLPNGDGSKCCFDGTALARNWHEKHRRSRLLYGIWGQVWCNRRLLSPVVSWWPEIGQCREMQENARLYKKTYGQTHKCKYKMESKQYKFTKLTRSIISEFKRPLKKGEMQKIVQTSLETMLGKGMTDLKKYILWHVISVAESFQVLLTEQDLKPLKTLVNKRHPLTRSTWSLITLQRIAYRWIRRALHGPDRQRARTRRLRCRPNGFDRSAMTAQILDPYHHKVFLFCWGTASQGEAELGAI